MGKHTDQIKYLVLIISFGLVFPLIVYAAAATSVFAAPMLALADDFVITIQTDNPGTSAATQFTIPTYSGSTYNYNVDCDNDGSNEATAQTGQNTGSKSRRLD